MRGVALDPVLIHSKGLVWNVMLQGSLGCRDREDVELEILRAANSLPQTSGSRLWHLQGYSE